MRYLIVGRGAAPLPGVVKSVVQTTRVLARRPPIVERGRRVYCEILVG